MPFSTVALRKPRVGESATTVVDDRLVVVRAAYDESYDNPFDTSERLGTIYSFNQRHATFLDRHRQGGPDAVREEFGEDAVFLSFFEHGQSWWGVMGAPAPAGVEFEWDGRRFAGVWVPTKTLMREADAAGEARGTPARRERMVKAAAKACDILTSWSNGEVYSVDLHIYALLRVAGSNAPILSESEYEDAEPLAATSAGGLLGDDALEREIESLGGLLLSHLDAA